MENLPRNAQVDPLFGCPPLQEILADGPSGIADIWEVYGEPLSGMQDRPREWLCHRNPVRAQLEAKIKQSSKQTKGRCQAASGSDMNVVLEPWGL